MLYIKSFSLLAACIVGLFGKQVHQGSGIESYDDGSNAAMVSKVSTYLVGPVICEQSMVFGKQTKPVDLGRFIDRLKCRITGHVSRHELGARDDQGSFYICTDIKNCHSKALLSGERKEAFDAISARYEQKKVVENESTYKERKFPYIG